MFNKDLDISKSFNNEDVSTLASVFWLSDMDNTVSSVKQLDTAQVAGNAEVIMKVCLGTGMKHIGYYICIIFQTYMESLLPRV